MACVRTLIFSSCTWFIGMVRAATVSPSRASMANASSPSPMRFRNCRRMRMPSPAPSVESMGWARASTKEWNARARAIRS